MFYLVKLWALSVSLNNIQKPVTKLRLIKMGFDDSCQSIETSQE